MNLSLFIARRYLFSRKKQNAINIISGISMVGVAIGTTALIVILSVFNGIDLLLQQNTDNLTPDLVISPAKGKFVEIDTLYYTEINRMNEIAYYHPVVEENALLKYGDNLKPVTLKGIGQEYEKHVNFNRNMIEGEFRLKSGDSFLGVIGYGVAHELGIGLKFLTPLKFYYPNKKSTSSLQAALNTEYLFPSGFFSSQQELDSKMVLTDIDFARRLFGIGNQISKVEVKLKAGADTENVKKNLQSLVGQNFKVEDKYELNRSFYAMMKSEKLAVFMVLLFILLIASFNIIGSISMLILDKKEDLGVFKALGMNIRRIVTLFKTEGILITASGAFVGLLIGVTVCLLQEKYGFIKLGDGSYIIEAYPVKLVWKDIVLIMGTVLLIGYMASYFPVKYLVNKLVGQKES
ncbi:MAG: ABC transporter permease [Oscillibacter sp.]|nr:ABC transporter permease [Oscillibacter sp.]